MDTKPLGLWEWPTIISITNKNCFCFRMTSKRVLTYLKLDNSNSVLAQFGQCLVSALLKKDEHDDINEVSVNCDLADGQGLVLSHPGPVLLRHPPFCPMYHWKKQVLHKNPGVSVAVAVILESSDTKVLITRRPPHMRTFPNVWVPPGGGSEEAETIQETGLREVLEETGLDLKPILTFSQPLCLWESVYPPLLAKGEPKRHTLVIYLHVLVSKDSKDLIKSIKLDPQETNACAFLNLEQIQLATNYDTKLDTNETLTVHELNGDHLKSLRQSYDLLRAEVPNSGSFDIERISTGTRFALEQFFNKKKRLQNFSNNKL